MEYWQVKTQTEFENDKGRIQKTMELYLTVAVSATDAEAKMYKHNEGMSNFRVVEVKKTKILDVIQ
ncbi:DUF4494 domain-containing protein [bacterium]|jgi:hypothetical protein|nr:DUF4494 domain-containing protein [bacterium]|tara:strand:+ start:527 stop:724 length:198 start_codon:yes stop_codon:yes gene_type:complete